MPKLISAHPGLIPRSAPYNASPAGAPPHPGQPDPKRHSRCRSRTAQAQGSGRRHRRRHSQQPWRSSRSPTRRSRRCAAAAAMPLSTRSSRSPTRRGRRCAAAAATRWSARSGAASGRACVRPAGPPTCAPAAPALPRRAAPTGRCRASGCAPRKVREEVGGGATCTICLLLEHYWPGMIKRPAGKQAWPAANRCQERCEGQTRSSQACACTAPGTSQHPVQRSIHLNAGTVTAATRPRTRRCCPVATLGFGHTPVW
jgi:hypothetical protein